MPLLKVPISTLRVFEAAARWQSFHAAASELNLTASAVSHSIRKMEETLGVVLFERIGRGGLGQAVGVYSHRLNARARLHVYPFHPRRPGCDSEYPKASDFT